MQQMDELRRQWLQEQKEQLKQQAEQLRRQWLQELKDQLKQQEKQQQRQHENEMLELKESHEATMRCALKKVTPSLLEMYSDPQREFYLDQCKKYGVPPSVIVQPGVCAASESEARI